MSKYTVFAHQFYRKYDIRMRHATLVLLLQVRHIALILVPLYWNFPLTIRIVSKSKFNSKIRKIRKFLIEWQVLNFNRWNIGWAKQILINNYLTLLILGFVFMLILEVELHVVKYYKISRFRRKIRPDLIGIEKTSKSRQNLVLTSWEIWKRTEWTFFVERSSRLDSSVSKFSFKIVQQCDTQLCASWGVKFPSSTTPFFP